MMSFKSIGTALARAAGFGSFVTAASEGRTYPTTIDSTTEASESPIEFRKESTVSRELIGAIDLTGQITYLDDDLETEINDTLKITQVGADQASFSYPAPSFATSTLPAIVKSIRVYAGKIFYRHAAEDGPIIDNLKDWDSIQRNGEKKLKIGNNFIVGKTFKGLTSQLEDIGNFWWQLIRSKPHTYQLIVSGAWYELEPGDIHTFEYSSEAENIDSVVEVVGVAVNDSEFPSTEITLQEIEENPKEDRSIKQRIRNKGSVNRSSRSSVSKIVAAAGYAGKADYYCTGVDDQDTINTAANSVRSGGKIQLTEGTYNTSDKMVFNTAVTIVGEGDKTIFNVTGKPADQPVFDCKEIVNLSNVKITADSEISNYVFFGYIKDGVCCSLNNVTIDIDFGDTSSGYSTFYVWYNDGTYDFQWSDRVMLTNCNTSGCNINFKGSSTGYQTIIKYGAECNYVNITLDAATTAKVTGTMGVSKCTGVRVTGDSDNIYRGIMSSYLAALEGSSNTADSCEIIGTGTRTTTSQHGISLMAASNCLVQNVGYGYVIQSGYPAVNCQSTDCNKGFSGASGNVSNSTATDCTRGFDGLNISNCNAEGCDYGYYYFTALYTSTQGSLAKNCTTGYINRTKCQQNRAESCTTDYSNCYADSSNLQAVADTADGGYNS